MTAKIGSKNVAQHRGRKERLAIKRANQEREKVRQAEARAKYRHEPKGGWPVAVVPNPAV